MAKKSYQNSFHEGLSMDMAKDVNKNTTISDAVNAVIVPKGGEIFELQNIKGNELVSFLPEGHFPKAIEVFNGIAYIVSNKYNSEGEYEYTEIGTYPSPEWSALFPDKIGISSNDYDGTVTDLSASVSNAKSQGFISTSDIQTVYSFEVPSDGPLTNIFKSSVHSWATASSTNENCDGTYPSVCDYGKLEFCYLEFNIYNDDGIDITNNVRDNVRVDILTFGENNGESFDIRDAFYVASDLYIARGTTYPINYLKHFNTFPWQLGDYDKSGTCGRDMVHRIMDFSSGEYNEIFDIPYINFPESNYTIVSNQNLIFVVKCDANINEHISFKTRLFAKPHDVPYLLKGIGLDTDTGSSFWTGDSFSTNTGYNNSLGNINDAYNSSVTLKNRGKSKIIFARHKLNININDNCNCSFYGNISNKKHYVSFRPLNTNYYNTLGAYHSVYNAEYNLATIVPSDKLILGADRAFIYDAIHSNSFTPSGLNTTGFDNVSTIKIYNSSDNTPFDDKRKGIPLMYGASIPNNNKYHKYLQSADDKIVIELDDNNLNDNYYVCYYNKLFTESENINDSSTKNNDIGLDIGEIFNSYFEQFDDNSMDTFIPTSSQENSLMAPMRERYRALFIDRVVYNTYLRGVISNMWLTRLPIINRISYSSNLMLNNGQRYFTSSGADIIAKVAEYGGFINNLSIPVTGYDFNDIDASETQVSVWQCINDGEKASVTFELNNTCCEGITKNALLHLKLDMPYFIEDEAKILFSSIYAYTGSIFKTFYSSSSNNEIILLFSGIPYDSDLELIITSNVSGILDAILSSIIIEHGYSYCTKDQYSHIKDKYCPIFNFNTDVSTEDIYLLDSQNSNFAFRSNDFIKDTDNDIELELQPNYDSTINLIINDKNSKVKLINSRFAFDPSNNRCFIPQKYGFNDDNVYSEKFIHGTELIRRTNKIIDVELVNTIQGGELHAGNYTYYFRLLDSDGNLTDIVNHTLPVSVFNIEDDMANNTGEKAGVNTNAAVKLKLSNFDRIYKGIEVSFVYSAGELNAEKLYYKIDKTYTIPLSDELIIVHTGLEDLKTLTYNDIIKSYNHHESIYSIVQGKKMLVLSNEKLSDVAIYSDIQKLALGVTITEGDKSIKTDDFYKDASNINNYTSYWRGETAQVGVILSLKKGGESPVFNFRGIDNISGIAEYGETIAINEFVGSYGENPYGIYRTALETPIVINNGGVCNDGVGGESYLHPHLVYLRLEKFNEFIESDLVKSIASGFTIVRKERVDDVFLEGFVTPAFEVPFGSGYVLDQTHDDDDYGATVVSSEHPYLNVTLGSTINQTGIANSIASEGTKKIHIAPFGIIQMYAGDDDTYYGTHKGYVFGSPADKHEINIFNALVKHNLNDKFGFISADLIADAEHFAAEFQGKGKYFMVNRSAVQFHLGNVGTPGSGCSTTSSIGQVLSIDETNTYAAICRLNSHLKMKDTFMSNSTESLYITEKVDTSTENSFASKLDQTNANFYTISYIGVTENIEDSSISSIISSYDQDTPYGFLTRVYRKSEGALSLADWITLYSSKYQEGGYFPVTPVYNIDRALDTIPNNIDNYYQNGYDYSKSLDIFGGDCFINKTYLRTLTKNGLDDNFDNYSNIWDYTGEVGKIDYMDKPFNREDPAANSWITDDEYSALKRSRLVPKAMWVEVMHESKYNLALRTTELHGTEDKYKYNKDRTFLPALSKAKTYIPTEQSSSQMDSKGYNKGYSDSIGAVLNYSYNDYEKLLRIFYSRIEVSDMAIKGALKNGYREFFGINYKDYDTQYGYISKVLAFNNTVYAIFERGITVIPLSEKTQVTGADGRVYIDNINLLGKDLVILSGTNGTIHPDSVISTKTGGYLFDHNNLAIIRFNGQNQPEDITAYKIETFLVSFKKKLEELRASSSLYISYNVKANYDILSGDIVFTFYIYEGTKDNLPDSCDIVYDEVNETPIENIIYDDSSCGKKYKYFDAGCDDEIIDTSLGDEDQSFTICYDIPSANSSFNILHQSSIYFNERLNKWVSPLSFNPNFEFTLNDKTFSMNLIQNQNRIYKHSSDNVNYCFFYDEQHNFSFEFIINQDQQVQKVLENLMIVSNERIPVTVSYDVDDKRSLVDNIITSGRTRNDYSLDMVQDIKTRRFEVKIIGLSVSNDYGIYLNTNDSYVHNIEVGYTFEINSTIYEIVGIASVLTDEGIEMPMLTINYFDGTVWNNINTILGSDIYNQVFGFVLEISIINVAISDSDYIEDHMYIQVQRAETEDGAREIRDRTIKVKVNYDGINKTLIHSIISTVELSLN